MIVFVCMLVTAAAGEGRERNLALDFILGWPSLKSKKKGKKMRSYFVMVSGFSDNSFTIKK